MRILCCILLFGHSIVTSQSLIKTSTISRDSLIALDSLIANKFNSLEKPLDVHALTEDLLKYSLASNDSSLIAMAYNRYAQLQYRIYDFKGAENNLKKAKSIYLRLKNYTKAVTTNQNLCIVYSANKELDKKEGLIEESLALSKKLNTFHIVFPYHEGTVFYSYDSKDYKRAIEFGELFFKKLDSLKSLEIQNQDFETIKKIEANVVALELANAYIQENRLDMPLSFLDEAKRYFITEVNDVEKGRRIYKHYVNYYTKLRTLDSIAKYNALYQEWNERYINELVKDFEQIPSIKSSLLEAEKNNEILKVKFQNQLDINKKNTIIIILKILFIGILLIMLINIFSSHRNLKKIYKDLADANTSTESILKQKLQLEQRIHSINLTLKNDLHDNFGNRLAGVISSYEVLKDLKSNKDNYNEAIYENFSANLEHSLHLLNNDLKDYLWANNVDNNNLHALKRRIEQFVQEIEKNYALTIDIHDNLNKNKNYRFPLAWNRQLLFIAKEIITNAVKHSKSNKLEIGISVKNKKVSLKFKDFGVGFDYEELQRKSGLDNMVNRARAVGIDLAIFSKKNDGTEITISGSLG